MATPKILGSVPEPYDGKPEKADAFINNLWNYFLNTTTFDTDEKKVSSALTYFKIGTPAGEWARHRQSAALSATPPDFGTWANFQTLFKAHFVPAHTELEATQYLHTNKMGNCHVSSRTGRASRAFHTDYHWDRLRSYLVLPSHARRLVTVMCHVL
jgi:hypothetical protein